MDEDNPAAHDQQGDKKKTPEFEFLRCVPKVWHTIPSISKWHEQTIDILSKAGFICRRRHFRVRMGGDNRFIGFSIEYSGEECGKLPSPFHLMVSEKFCGMVSDAVSLFPASNAFDGCVFIESEGLGDIMLSLRGQAVLAHAEVESIAAEMISQLRKQEPCWEGYLDKYCKHLGLFRPQAKQIEDGIIYRELIPGEIAITNIRRYAQPASSRAVSSDAGDPNDWMLRLIDIAFHAIYKEQLAARETSISEPREEFKPLASYMSDGIPKKIVEYMEANQKATVKEAKTAMRIKMKPCTIKLRLRKLNPPLAPQSFKIRMLALINRK